MRGCRCGAAAIAALAVLPAARAGAEMAGTAGSALALAALVAPYSPTLATGDKRVIDALFNGNPNAAYPAGKQIAVAADKIVCKSGNVDITLHSCALTFGAKTVTVSGWRAHELYATIGEVGVPVDGAMGTLFEALSQLNCTIDPGVIKQKAGGGASCSFTPGAG
jgi:hypothetical protein